MEGLSIDVKKFASDASTFFNRARQYTEEQLGQGKISSISRAFGCPLVQVLSLVLAEKTQLDEEVSKLWNRFETTNETITKLKSSVEGIFIVKAVGLMLSRPASAESQFADGEDALVEV